MASKRKLKEERRKIKRLEDESITLNAFMVRYLGIRDNNILSNKISHEDIKVLFPNLVRTSFSYIADNPDLVYTGDVLLVEDSFGRTVPYFDPCYVYVEDDYYGDFLVEDNKEDIPNLDELDLASLSNYELQNLLRIYEKNNMYVAVRKVRNELTVRKDSHRASSLSKHKVLKKERKNEKFEY